MLNFSEKLLAWSQIHGRKDLPWQTPHTPYRVWLSEIMLQQTQVQTVIPYFLNFISQIPDIHALAAANLDEVLSLWSGLGYYSRARNLHRCAQIIVKEFSGIFPSDLKILQSLPGIGRSTAAAIASLAFNLPTAIMDGNVKRVLSRYFLIKEASNSALEKRLWLQAELCMPHDHCRDYTQAIMDMGATCCSQKNPNCFDHVLECLQCLQIILKVPHKFIDLRDREKIPGVLAKYLTDNSTFIAIEASKVIEFIVTRWK